MTVGGSLERPPQHEVLPAPVWGDPPDVTRGGAAQYVALFAPLILAMRHRPRDWALVARAQRSGNAAKLATNIRAGRYGFDQTAEVWEATSRLLPDGSAHGVWVRYLGPDERALDVETLADTAKVAGPIVTTSQQLAEVKAPDGSTALPTHPDEIIDRAQQQCAACGVTRGLHDDGSVPHAFVDLQPATGDQYPCEVCGEPCRSPQARGAHMRHRHPGESAWSRKHAAAQQRRRQDRPPVPAGPTPHRSPDREVTTPDKLDPLDAQPDAEVTLDEPEQVLGVATPVTREPTTLVSVAGWVEPAEVAAYAEPVEAEVERWRAAPADPLPDGSCCTHPPRLHDDEGCRVGRLSDFADPCGCSASRAVAENSQSG